MDACWLRRNKKDATFAVIGWVGGREERVEPCCCCCCVGEGQGRGVGWKPRGLAACVTSKGMMDGASASATGWDTVVCPRMHFFFHANLSPAFWLPTHRILVTRPSHSSTTTSHNDRQLFSLPHPPSVAQSSLHHSVMRVIVIAAFLAGE